MSSTTPPDVSASRNTAIRGAGKVVGFVDERITSSNWLKRNLRKIFPDHWSFLLGEIALFSLILIILSGVFLTFWFKPSMAHITYEGAYVPMRGIAMSEAYASTLELSFEVRGGLLMRQVHHWSTLVFIAAMSAHMLRVFFTGAFRKPRELNWLVGLTLLVLGVANGFTGYSLPDDLLSGTGLRIIEGGILAIPVVGTYLSYFIFGGEYPGEDIITRLYAIHILLVPGLIVALVTVHLMILWYQKHTQWPGSGKSEKNVVGYPFFPIYMTKAGGFMFIVFGFILLMSATVQINPVWLYGPYDPSQVTAGVQPDWYIGFLDGGLRLMPPWEISIFGYNIPLSVLIPAMILPGVILTLLAVYPWIEQKVTGDKREHHILDRPRNMPVRTSLGVAFIVFYIVLWIAGGNDFFATVLEIPVNWVSRFLQFSLILMPPIAFWITKRICLGLQRREREKVLHGRESGMIVVSPEGEFTERHEPLDPHEAYELVAHERPVVREPEPATDPNGVPNPNYKKSLRRARLSHFYFADVIDKPTRDELERVHHHHEEIAPSSNGETPQHGASDDQGGQHH
ncbi:cytochrome bc complex cytochrome b subunit [Actinobacteria bacterium YIM 96077]|uniref:Cytochrome bc1 complex cytochrome b subunit n=1 Tax=Phytoactinopolyspora halophila TaxID=1981511 RepID=A0A329QHM3_9ACTN|nr:cytochrome bc complex cytochrome b subunit [Phytoactinopolyspora halophila]AYY13676.1 cytochrome bc complex cytochrome b subunit [Actinobacteria bacterium YIM 96077]RAW11239.1 ubiquinol-cytochrome c reductase cytochrome b subunit [Phytoactinopolyspora halophila]